MRHGKVLAVTEEIVGAHLTADAASSATTLYLDDPSYFIEGGGAVTITDSDNTEPATYLWVDADLGTMGLSAGTVNAYAAGASVQVSPQQKSRFAYVQLDDPDVAPVTARVPFALYSLIALGIRSDIVGADESTADSGEEVTLELQRGVWVLTDVLRQVPVIDPSFLPAADTQIFTTAGSFTWNKPEGFRIAHVVVIGGGGGGGSGRLGDTGTQRAGGGGGGGAQLVIMDIPIGLLGASESVTVGAAGAGAAANISLVSGVTVTGNPGDPGGDSVFGSWATAKGGFGGGVGAGSGGGGGATAFGAGQYALGGRGAGGGDGGMGSGGSAPTAGGNTPNVTDGKAGSAGAAGGGGGGGMDASNNPGDGAIGGRAWGLTAGTAGTSPAGVGVGGGGSATDLNPVPGAGGGGGGSGNNNNVGGAGGDGGNYGGGGGGGGGSSTATQGNTGGAGGDGGVAIVAVICS